MKIVALVLAIFLAAAGGAVAQQSRPRVSEPPSGTARIRGTVVDASTGTPVRRAALRLTMIPATLGTWTATTDGSGAFELPGLPAGRFSLRVSKGGFITVGPGQQTPTDRANPIETANGSTVDLSPIRLPRGGVITGRIGDEYGDVVPEITVQAFRAEYMQGVRRLTSVRSAQTNDIGEFRIYGLQPGTYYVAATARAADGSPLQVTEPGTQAVRGGGGVAPTFFPGTASASEAQRIGVVAGTEAPGVDFSLLAVRLARISGVVVDSRGRLARDYAVMLQPARPDGALLGGASVAETDAEGRFTIENVAPNDYRLDARAKSYFEAVARSGRVGQTQAADALEFASVPLTVTGADLASIPVRLTAGHMMTGRVMIRGAAPDPRTLNALRVSVMPGTGGVSATMLAAHAPVAGDGTFQVRGLMGRLFVRVSGLPSGWALEGVRTRGLDITDEGVDILENVEDVEIVVTARPAGVAGVVTDAAGTLVPEAVVMIFPEAPEYRTAPHNRFVATGRTGADGKFDVRALPAATYFAVAVPSLADGEWAEPEQLERMASRATRFTLAEGESKIIALRLHVQ